MKTGVKIVNKTLVVLFLFYSFFNTMNAQEHYNNEHSGEIPKEIIFQSLSNSNLWEESTLNFNSVSTLYILNHGVELELPTNLELGGKPVVLINKGDIDALGNPPYFLFHTLNINDVNAFVRIYLSYDLNGERKTNNVEIYLLKTTNGWEISNNQL